jgi:hypothetical protein
VTSNALSGSRPWRHNIQYREITHTALSLSPIGQEAYGDFGIVHELEAAARFALFEFDAKIGTFDGLVIAG